MGRPPIPARKRELRARSLGEQVEQHMERQGKQYGRAGLDAALQVVRHQFGVAQRTAYDLWKEHGNWKARREQEIVDSMIDPVTVDPIHSPLRRHLLETTSALRGGPRPIETLTGQRESIRPIEKGSPPIRTAGLRSWIRR